MSTLAKMIGQAFGNEPKCLCSADDVPLPAARRRRKLWDLPQQYHCALIGTCLPVPEMRKLAPHSGYDVSAMSDYSLHTVVVGYCAERNELSKAIQQFLDKRHGPVVARFLRAADGAAAMALWREALARGEDIAGALWAAWTHPAIDDDSGRDIHGDIHMLSHQAGAAVRADLRQLERHKAEAERLRQEVDGLRRGMGEMQRAHDRTLAALRAELAAAEQRAAQHRARELDLAGAAREQRRSSALQQRAAALARRVETLEAGNANHARHAAQLERALADSRAELAAAEVALAAALGVCDGVSGGADCGKSCVAEQALAGRCVLCVGGRTGLVDGYRRLVEVRGGRFLHHDGGQEESLHRIDAAIVSADAVVCQSGCVSHAAYWRLKDACKKLGKPCVFVESPGIGSFARGLLALVDPTVSGQAIRGAAPRHRIAQADVRC